MFVFVAIAHRETVNCTTKLPHQLSCKNKLPAVAEAATAAAADTGRNTPSKTTNCKAARDELCDYLCDIRCIVYLFLLSPNRRALNRDTPGSTCVKWAKSGTRHGSGSNMFGHAHQVCGIQHRNRLISDSCGPNVAGQCHFSVARE